MRFKIEIPKDALLVGGGFLQYKGILFEIKQYKNIEGNKYQLSEKFGDQVVLKDNSGFYVVAHKDFVKKIIKK